jgi:amidase
MNTRSASINPAHAEAGPDKDSAAAQAAPKASLSRRRFLGTGMAAGTALAFARFSPNAFADPAPGDVLSKSASEVAKMIRNKQISAVELVNRCYARIDEVNPKINAVVAVCRERALVEAKQADEALAAGKSLGPLHGVPFTIKDSFDSGTGQGRRRHPAW